MKKTILIAAAALALASCGGNAQKRTATADAAKTTLPAPDGHTAHTSLDVEGTYTGLFPAADCPGIRMTLRLQDDGAYEQTMEYVDRDTSYDEEGAYTLEGNLLTLIPSENGEKSYYQVEENRLSRLDAERKPITGELAEHYVLTKNTAK